MDIEKCRLSYYPDKVKVLFVGESPPKSGTFFYFGDSNLFSYTMEAFCKAFQIEYSDAFAFLNAFKANGFYLEDLCQTPVNNMDNPTRRKMHKDSIAKFSNRLSQISPKIIISVMKSIKKPVDKSLLLASMTNVQHFSLPFPAMSHQHKYVMELSQILVEINDKKIINYL